MIGKARKKRRKKEKARPLSLGIFSYKILDPPL